MKHLILKTSGILALAAMVMTTRATAQNLVTNGDFSNPTTASYNSYAAGSTDLPGWMVDTIPSDGVQLGQSGLFATAAIGSTDQQLQLTGGTAYSLGGGIQQTLDTTLGDSYLITLDVASRSGDSVVGALDFGGQLETIDTSDPTLSPDSWTLTATSSSTLLDITGYADSANGQLIISDVSVTPTPEPATLALAGLGGLVLLRRNRK